MQSFRDRIRSAWRIWLLILAVAAFPAHNLKAQTAEQETLSTQIQKLTDAIAHMQSQLDESQRQMTEMRKDLAALQAAMTQQRPGAAASATLDSAPVSSSSGDSSSSESIRTAIDELRERQALQESQIATHEQEKAESESKFPVTITGLLLFNGFVNTGAVDQAATPTTAVPGAGSTGASVRQTILGFDARGPHLFGARSYADLRVDFEGNLFSGSAGANYAADAALLRLRTAHANLLWKNTGMYFSFDRPIFNPNSPSSLTAVAEPALAWSGNLWAWNPQLGARRDMEIAGSRTLRFEGALIDAADAPGTPEINPSPSPALLPGGVEQSRWPGVEAHVSLFGSALPDDGDRIGIGSYFSPHHSSLGYNFKAWAGTLDEHFLLPAHLQLVGSFYRGLALGGLGGGAFKDFAYGHDPDSGAYYIKPLDDVGGWTELKEKFSQRVELNAAYGMDEVFAHELRPYTNSSGIFYQNLARNRTFTGNVIFSPSAYLLFSIEYRYIASSPVTGLSAGSNVIGLGAGYKF